MDLGLSSYNKDILNAAKAGREEKAALNHVCIPLSPGPTKTILIPEVIYRNFGLL